MLFFIVFFSSYSTFLSPSVFPVKKKEQFHHLNTSKHNLHYISAQSSANHCIRWRIPNNRNCCVPVTVVVVFPIPALFTKPVVNHHHWLSKSTLCPLSHLPFTFPHTINPNHKSIVLYIITSL